MKYLKYLILVGFIVVPKDGYGGNVTMTLRFLDARILGVEVDGNISLAEMYEYVTQEINGFASTNIDSSQLKLIQQGAIVPYNGVDKVYDKDFERENCIHVIIDCRSKNKLKDVYKKLIDEIKYLNINKQFVDVRSAIKELTEKLNESDSKAGSLKDLDLLCVLRYLLTEFGVHFTQDAPKEALQVLLFEHLELLKHPAPEVAAVGGLLGELLEDLGAVPVGIEEAVVHGGAGGGSVAVVSAYNSNNLVQVEKLLKNEFNVKYKGLISKDFDTKKVNLKFLSERYIDKENVGIRAFLSSYGYLD